ncbi:helix-turn-helix domain-containing protein [Paenibacillus rhizoplanae]
MEPGEGAVEFMREITEGMTLEEVRELYRHMMRIPPDDAKVKRCATCNYYFRDKTRPGNAKVCGPSCKTVRKTEQKADQRARKPVEPKKPKKERRYDEAAWLAGIWRHEVPFDPGKLPYIQAARERYSRMGGRKKSRSVRSITNTFFSWRQVSIRGRAAKGSFYFFALRAGCLAIRGRFFYLPTQQKCAIKEANAMNIDHTTVRMLREVHRLTLCEMGALLNVSASHLWRVEKGERAINEDMQRRCIAELELTPAKLERIISIYEEMQSTLTAR